MSFHVVQKEGLVRLTQVGSCSTTKLLTIFCLKVYILSQNPHNYLKCFICEFITLSNGQNQLMDENRENFEILFFILKQVSKSQYRIIDKGNGEDPNTLFLACFLRLLFLISYFLRSILVAILQNLTLFIHYS